MREIKFRAWDGEKMHEWNSTDHGATDQITGTPYPKLFYLPMSWLAGDSNDWKWMQYTGTKDKNRKEIYEGDILENKTEESIISIRWDETGGGWRFDEHNTFMDDGVGRGDWDFTMGIARNCEIIGNIYENPELIK